MIILGIDTSGKQGGIALWRDGEVLDSAPIEGGTFSAQLIPLVSQLLAKNKLEKEDIEGFAVASGPGSFTGLRVGLAAVKGLAEILGKPIATVPVLEALAIVSGVKGNVVAILDAQRQEAYVGEYDAADGGAKMLREELHTQAGMIDRARKASEAGVAVVTSDSSIASVLAGAGLVVIIVERPGAAEMARTGAGKIARGETVTVEQLDANYIRVTDAEIFAKPGK
ncbi:MAG: tRNA (adenosine(37)-N6)-threonylcarbamoyltransferase complex dimerization subunit type 1 TsaB [Candidatus Koribacter versatilis]|uniref:tRNA (Adenosine(37)-N6)-threonylcarbamoyltransferase complex dimerization subunit type 1 TsaB n=1 Tax=Candidatus Korobacter versatilis TaxID=658062 RepID=A0A932A743_9BACT|nr:tRNA (adenosine(37)-N6)-threonylcarbamoyltransferase complex dimerization subunit type 1 TsaB [Candidatus Koribacter versatilis]